MFLNHLKDEQFPVKGDALAKQFCNFQLDGFINNSKKRKGGKDNKTRRKIHKRLDLKANKHRSDNNMVFGSHSFHEVTMTYPMRYVR